MGKWANGTTKSHKASYLKFCWKTLPLDTGRKLNVHRTFKRRPECIMYVQYASFAQGVVVFLEL